MLSHTESRIPPLPCFQLAYSKYISNQIFFFLLREVIERVFSSSFYL